MAIFKGLLSQKHHVMSVDFPRKAKIPGKNLALDSHSNTTIQQFTPQHPPLVKV
jgi:hypothetical protein